MSEQPNYRPALPLIREVSRVPILTVIDRNGDDLAWHGQAACAGLGDVMFPAARIGRIGVDYRDALAICRGTATTPGCPVLEECLEWALEAGEPHGCWGGATPMQRQRMAQRRAEAS